MSAADERGSWTLLTGHGHVLVEIARNPTARIRDISAAADLTERTFQGIVAVLEAAGYMYPHPDRPPHPVLGEPQPPVSAHRPGRTSDRPVPRTAHRERQPHHSWPG